jgi:hypothetical protein
MWFLLFLALVTGITEITNQEDVVFYTTDGYERKTKRLTFESNDVGVTQTFTYYNESSKKTGTITITPDMKYVFVPTPVGYAPSYIFLQEKSICDSENAKKLGEFPEVPGYIYGSVASQIYQAIQLFWYGDGACATIEYGSDDPLYNSTQCGELINGSSPVAVLNAKFEVMANATKKETIRILGTNKLGYDASRVVDRMASAAILATDATSTLESEINAFKGFRDYYSNFSKELELFIDNETTRLTYLNNTRQNLQIEMEKWRNLDRSVKSVIENNGYKQILNQTLTIVLDQLKSISEFNATFLAQQERIINNFNRTYLSMKDDIERVGKSLYYAELAIYQQASAFQKARKLDDMTRLSSYAFWNTYYTRKANASNSAVCHHPLITDDGRAPATLNSSTDFFTKYAAQYALSQVTITYASESRVDGFSYPTLTQEVFTYNCDLEFLLTVKDDVNKWNAAQLLSYLGPDGCEVRTNSSARYDSLTNCRCHFVETSTGCKMTNPTFNLHNLYLFENITSLAVCAGAPGSIGRIIYSGHYPVYHRDMTSLKKYLGWINGGPPDSSCEDFIAPISTTLPPCRFTLSTSPDIRVYSRNAEKLYYVTQDTTNSTISFEAFSGQTTTNTAFDYIFDKYASLDNPYASIQAKKENLTDIAHIFALDLFYGYQAWFLLRPRIFREFYGYPPKSIIAEPVPYETIMKELAEKAPGTYTNSSIYDFSQTVSNLACYHVKWIEASCTSQPIYRLEYRYLDASARVSIYEQGRPNTSFTTSKEEVVTDSEEAHHLDYTFYMYGYRDCIFSSNCSFTNGSRASFLYDIPSGSIDVDMNPGARKSSKFPIIFPPMSTNSTNVLDVSTYSPLSPAGEFLTPFLSDFTTYLPFDIDYNSVFASTPEHYKVQTIQDIDGTQICIIPRMKYRGGLCELLDNFKMVSQNTSVRPDEQRILYFVPKFQTFWMHFTIDIENIASVYQPRLITCPTAIKLLNNNGKDVAHLSISNQRPDTTLTLSLLFSVTQVNQSTQAARVGYGSGLFENCNRTYNVVLNPLSTEIYPIPPCGNQSLTVLSGTIVCGKFEIVQPLNSTSWGIEFGGGYFETLLNNHTVFTMDYVDPATNNFTTFFNDQYDKILNDHFRPAIIDLVSNINGTETPIDRLKNATDGMRNMIILLQNESLNTFQRDAELLNILDHIIEYSDSAIENLELYAAAPQILLDRINGLRRVLQDFKDLINATEIWNNFTVDAEDVVNIMPTPTDEIDFTSLPPQLFYWMQAVYDITGYCDLLHELSSDNYNCIPEGYEMWPEAEIYFCYYGYAFAVMVYIQIFLAPVVTAGVLAMFIMRYALPKEMIQDWARRADPNQGKRDWIFFKTMWDVAAFGKPFPVISGQTASVPPVTAARIAYRRLK